MKLFGTILNDVKKGKFIPQNWIGNKNFLNTDGKKLYEQNLLKTPTDWEYRNKKVNYTYNKQKYRTIEFNKIDWSNSVVIFGCSNVFGVGLDDSDTISFNLSKLINRPVINMGSPGTSIKYSFHNNLILKNYYPTPYAVVNIWTGYYRDILYYKKSIHNIGSWTTDLDYAKNLLSEEHHMITESYFNMLATKSLWQTKYVELTQFPENTKHYDLDCISAVDNARDLLHPGSKTSKLVAEYIMSKL